jgi:hypothetical protein
MFTPIGFFAAEEAGGLPAVVQNFDVFYSADQTTTFTDQTANGNNGTVSVAGSGGTSAITHVGGATPYWDFTAPNPTTEQSYVETNVAPGALSDNTAFSIFVVFQDPDLTVNNTLYYAVDGGTDQMSMGTSRTTDKIFANLRGGSNKQILSTTILSENTWYMAIITYGGNIATDIYQLTLNNEARGGDTPTTLDITNTIKIGFTGLSSTTVNRQKIAAWGWASGYELSSTDRTDLFNYYDASYSFPSV